jgi:hypothetical protein
LLYNLRHIYTAWPKENINLLLFIYAFALRGVKNRKVIALAKKVLPLLNICDYFGL